MGNVINYYTIYINNIIAAEESLAEFLRARDSFSIMITAFSQQVPLSGKTKSQIQFLRSIVEPHKPNHALLHFSHYFFRYNRMLLPGSFHKSNR